MTETDRLWYTVALAHGGPVGPERRPGRDEIDLTRRPARPSPARDPSSLPTPWRTLGATLPSFQENPIEGS